MTNKPEDRIPFFSFLKSKDQYLDWGIIVCCCLLGYIFLKVCHPYPATMSDSTSYVYCAQQDVFFTYRPFGYSYFLQIVHLFSASIHTLFIVQITLYALTAAGLAFTIKYFFTPINRTVWSVLLFFFVCSPLAFYMANAIMSDLLFAVTIYIMLASAVFILKRQSWIGLGLFLIALFCALHIRYSAILFPLLFMGLFLFNKGKIRWISIAAIISVTFIFYQQIKENMYETTRLKQFSTGFDGWQMANNAMHIEPFINLNPNHIKNKEIAQLHYFMTLYKEKIATMTNNGKNVSAGFMWLNDLPLKQYLDLYIDATNESYPIAWSKLGSNQYREYGQYMITRYPWLFLKYYFLPNAKQVFYPSSTGIMGVYEPIDIQEYTYFQFPSNVDTKARYNLFTRLITPIIPVLYVLLWIITAAIVALTIYYRKSFHLDRESKVLFGFFILFGLAYYASTVFASPIELRYWLPMNAIHFTYIYISLNYIMKALCYKKQTVQ
ncbi:hypothetical protein [Parabacteroides sp. PF5-9]|uniref:hypothetical protein n=1 Tax=Parabacteroides sp. PF5-9 TaxID=1742404 RepID=UPI0024738B50|nr:hypothetical protein [Parabacteroides sp. PF5-9]MDH6359116.1 uncharacterized protein YxeA [Parabacteroides sp. PF5-9]